MVPPLLGMRDISFMRRPSARLPGGDALKLQYLPSRGLQGIGPLSAAEPELSAPLLGPVVPPASSGLGKSYMRTDSGKSNIIFKQFSRK